MIICPGENRNMKDLIIKGQGYAPEEDLREKPSCDIMYTVDKICKMTYPLS